MASQYKIHWYLYVPWVLDRLFGLAERFVRAADCYPAVALLPDGRNAHSRQQPPRRGRC
jgi:hypothetical protein